MTSVAKGPDRIWTSPGLASRSVRTGATTKTKAVARGRSGAIDPGGHSPTVPVAATGVCECDVGGSLVCGAIRGERDTLRSLDYETQKRGQAIDSEREPRTARVKRWIAAHLPGND